MNSVLLIGRISNDLDLRYTTDGKAVLKFNLAVQRMNKDEADFPRVTIFNKQAENTQRYCHKGSAVAVQGRIQTGSYKDKEGRTVYTTDIIGDRIEFLSGREPEQADGEPRAEIPEFSMLDEDVPF